MQINLENSTMEFQETPIHILIDKTYHIITITQNIHCTTTQHYFQQSDLISTK